MEENTPATIETPPPPQPTPAEIQSQQQQRKMAIIAGIAGFIVLALIVGFAYFLLLPQNGGPNGATSRIRDVFIIFMALEASVIGIALVILIIQLATLINLLQNEIKPILNSTNDTVNTLRGTVTFLSDNLAEPVIKLNEYMAAAKKFIDLIRPPRF
jgi:amino acid permease